MKKICQMIQEHRIIVIFRQLYGEALVDTVNALYKGGIRLVEVTFDQSDSDHLTKTSNAIKLLDSTFPDMAIGAGTVITKEQVRVAIEANAKYIISPNTNQNIIELTKQAKSISIPGALTPSEILLAHESGADFVKIFPAKSIGMGYIKDLMGPINHVKMIATAGVTEQNFKEFLEIGCVGAGISGRLTDREVIRQSNFDVLTQRAESLVQQVIEFNNKR